MGDDERERIARWIEEYAMWHARRSYGEDEDEVPALLTLADLLADGVRRGEPRMDASLAARRTAALAAEAAADAQPEWKKGSIEFSGPDIRESLPTPPAKEPLLISPAPQFFASRDAANAISESIDERVRRAKALGRCVEPVQVFDADSEEHVTTSPCWQLPPEWTCPHKKAP